MIRIFRDTDTGGGGGGKDEKKDVKPSVTAPANYKPLVPAERQQWNDFLDYVGSKGLGGSPKLDERDQSLGLNLMNQYKKTNPNFSLTPNDISRIQYDQYLLRKGDSFPTLSANQLSYARNSLSPAYMARPVSGVDNWLGSLTSKQFYPIAIRKTAQGDIPFGTDIESWTKDIK